MDPLRRYCCYGRFLGCVECCELCCRKGASAFDGREEWIESVLEADLAASCKQRHVAGRVSTGLSTIAATGVPASQCSAACAGPSEHRYDRPHPEAPANASGKLLSTNWVNHSCDLGAVNSILAIDAATKGVCSVTVSWLNFYAGAVCVLVMLDGVFGLMLLGRLLEPMARGSRTIALLSQNTFAIMCHQLLGMFVATSAIALASKFTPWFNSLDMQSYLWRFDYAWFPNGLAEFTWAYVVFGIAFAIWFQRVIDGGVAVICRMLRCMFRCNES